MRRPNVLLVVAHPGVGGGLETLLRIERRYDVRRAMKLSEAATVAKSWPADAALVDAPMLSPGTRLVLGVPALVLTGSDDDGHAIAALLDDARGWLRKDASPAELIAAVDELLPGRPGATAGPLSLVAVGALLVVLAALLLYLLWIAIV